MLLTHDLFDELSRHINKGGSQQCPNSGSLKESVGYGLFLKCIMRMVQKKAIFEHLKQVLLCEAFNVFITVMPFIKLCIMLREIQGRSVND